MVGDLIWRNEDSVHTKTYTQMFIAALGSNLDTTQMPFKGEQLSKLWFIYSGILLSNTKEQTTDKHNISDESPQT